MGAAWLHSLQGASRCRDGGALGRAFVLSGWLHTSRKMKDTLRWISLLPISAAASAASYFLVKLWLIFSPIIPWDWLERFTIWWAEVIASFMLGCTFLWAGYCMAPKKKIVAVYVLAALSVLYIAGCAWGDWVLHHQFKTASVVATLLGMIQGVAYAHQDASKAPRLLTSRPAA